MKWLHINDAFPPVGVPIIAITGYNDICGYPIVNTVMLTQNIRGWYCWAICDKGPIKPNSDVKIMYWAPMPEE